MVTIGWRSNLRALTIRTKTGRKCKPMRIRGERIRNRTSFFFFHRYPPQNIQSRFQRFNWATDFYYPQTNGVCGGWCFNNGDFDINRRSNERQRRNRGGNNNSSSTTSLRRRKNVLGRGYYGACVSHRNRRRRKALNNLILQNAQCLLFDSQY